MTAAPPVLSEPPALQTMRWLLRPIAFMESCRRRFGDAFGIRLVGFRTPLFMVTDPDVIRALYAGAGPRPAARAERRAAAAGGPALAVAARGRASTSRGGA